MLSFIPGRYETKVSVKKKYTLSVVSADKISAASKLLDLMREELCIVFKGEPLRAAGG